MSVVKMNLDDNEDLRKETYLEEIAARDPPRRIPPQRRPSPSNM